MKTRTFPMAVVYSLGAHGLALVLIIMANAAAVKPRQTVETVNFIQASLIYAQDGRSSQETSPPLYQARAARSVNRPLEARAAIIPANDQETAEKPVTGGVRLEQEKDIGSDAPRSPHLSPGGSDGGWQTVSPGIASGNQLPAGRPGESGRAPEERLILPRYLNTARPAYPLLARLRGNEGTVLLEVQVQADGGVGEVRIKKSSGYALLDQAALNAVRAWRFEPASMRGVPLVMSVDIPIRFALNESD